MATKRLSLEVTTEAVALQVTGPTARQETRHLLTATLLWPRLSVARKISTQFCRLRDGKVRFDTQDWCDAILFKETVEGRFGLAVSLSEAISDEQLEAFLRFVGNTAFGMAAKLVDDWFGPVGKLAAAPLDFAARQISKTGDPEILAAGVAPLDTAAWTNGERAFPIVLPLRTPREIVRIRRSRAAAASGKTARMVRTVLLPKDAPNGEVRLRVQIL